MDFTTYGGLFFRTGRSFAEKLNILSAIDYQKVSGIFQIF